ncbi:MAG TPA: DUF6252 family protein [Candidatus Kapabacteria bacterium]|nr:DUF6252 family protein [Candidatus Kapabacteria bacterium]
MKKGLIFAFLLAICSSCSPSFDYFGDPSPVEYIGPNGEHFDAIIENNNWWASYPVWTGPSLQLYAHLDGTFTLYVIKFSYPDSRLTVVSNFTGLGTYSLGDSSTGSYAWFVRQASDSSFHHFYTDHLHHGTLEITAIDTTLRLISGTISFTAIEKDSVITLHNGTFKAQYPGKL